jgi:hypothetical protein
MEAQAQRSGRIYFIVGLTVLTVSYGVAVLAVKYFFF